MVKVYRIGFSPLGHEGGPTKKDDPYKINIIFVHGLRGHPKNTWGRGSEGTEGAAEDKEASQKSILRLKSKKKLPRPFWPYEFLRDDIPEARIWTYGYNAEVIKGFFNANNKNTISQHGQDLAVRFEREIDNDDPVIFVAHSLGGILTKDAVMRSADCRSRTKFVVFLGTPHRGSFYAKEGGFLARLTRFALQDANHKLVEGLELKNEILSNLLVGFNTIVWESGMKVHSFQELHGVKHRKNKIVDDFSSRLGLPSPMETVESMNTDHRGLTKFNDRDDPGYIAVSGVLKRFIRSYLCEDTLIPAQEEASTCVAQPVAPAEQREEKGGKEETAAAEEKNVAVEEGEEREGQEEHEQEQEAEAEVVVAAVEEDVREDVTTAEEAVASKEEVAAKEETARQETRREEKEGEATATETGAKKTAEKEVISEGDKAAKEEARGEEHVKEEKNEAGPIKMITRRRTTFQTPFPADKRLKRRATALGGEAVCELGYYISRCLCADGRAGEAAEMLEHVMSAQGSMPAAGGRAGGLASRQTFPRAHRPATALRRISVS